jgi:hypothetical protein
LLIVDHDLLFLEIGSDCGLRHANFLVDVLLKQGGLADARVSENDNLEELFLATHLSLD